MLQASAVLAVPPNGHMGNAVTEVLTSSVSVLVSDPLCVRSMLGDQEWRRKATILPARVRHFMGDQGTSELSGRTAGAGGGSGFPSRSRSGWEGSAEMEDGEPRSQRGLQLGSGRTGEQETGRWGAGREKGRGPGAAGAAAAESLGSCSGNLHLIPCVFGFSGVRNDPEACTLRMRTLF